MIVSKTRLYEDSDPTDNVVKLRSSLLYQLYDRKIPCEEHSDYIKTEILDIYPREDGCTVVTNSTLNIQYSKEFKFKKLTNDTSPEKISSIAEKIISKCLNITIGDVLKQ